MLPLIVFVFELCFKVYAKGSTKEGKKYMLKIMPGGAIANYLKQNICKNVKCDKLAD